MTHLAVAQPGLGKKALVDLATQKLAQQPGASVFITRSDVRAYAARNALQGPSSDRIAPIIAATRDVFLDCLTMVDEVAQVIAKEWQKDLEQQQTAVGSSGELNPAKEAGVQTVALIQALLQKRRGSPPEEPSTGTGFSQRTSPRSMIC